MEVQSGSLRGCAICVVIHETDGAFFGHPKILIESPSKREFTSSGLISAFPLLPFPLCPVHYNSTDNTRRNTLGIWLLCVEMANKN